jgi:hypothetical protein
MLRVYVAGAYSAPNVIDVLNNMRRGMRASAEVLLAGFAPFSPWLDYNFQLQLRDGESLSVDDYYAYSMTWLEASDIVYVIPGWENSKGTLAEISRANALNIPVVYSMTDLKKVAENVSYHKKLKANIAHLESTENMLNSLDETSKDKEFMMQL